MKRPSRIKREVYSGYVKLNGEEHKDTLMSSQQLRGVPW